MINIIYFFIKKNKTYTILHMNEIIEIKRKEFEVIEQLGDRSFKVTRKGQFYFLKKFEDDAKGFEKFVDAEHKLRVSGVVNPKCLIYDKKTRIAVTEFIEGDNCLEALLGGELPETVIELLFKTFWYARTDRMTLDYSPENFKFVNGKLYYLPFKVEAFVDKEKFIQQDIRLWFFTKDFIKYCRLIGIPVDESHLKSDYEVNRSIALLTVKYYR